MKSGTLQLGLVGLISMAAGALLFHWLQPQPTNPPASSTAAIELHSIPLRGLDGSDSKLEDWRGNILIVNLWAPWCAPCRREVPTLIDFHRDLADQQVKVLGIAIDGEVPVRQFADEYAINYPLFLAGNGSAMYNAALGNPSGSLPFTAIVDRELNIRFRHNGEITADQLRSQLAPLLAAD